MSFQGVAQGRLDMLVLTLIKFCGDHNDMLMMNIDHDVYSHHVYLSLSHLVLQ